MSIESLWIMEAIHTRKPRVSYQSEPNHLFDSSPSTQLEWILASAEGGVGGVVRRNEDFANSGRLVSDDPIFDRKGGVLGDISRLVRLVGLEAQSVTYGC